MNQYPLIKGKTDLRTRFPDVAAWWDRDKNGELGPEDVQPGSIKKYGGSARRDTAGRPLYTAGRQAAGALIVPETG